MKNQMSIKVGDIVKLNSCDQTMTVKQYDTTTENLLCVWFDKYNQLQEAVFNIKEIIRLCKV